MSNQDPLAPQHFPLQRPLHYINSSITDLILRREQANFLMWSRSSNAQTELSCLWMIQVSLGIQVDGNPRKFQSHFSGRDLTLVGQGVLWERDIYGEGIVRVDFTSFHLSGSTVRRRWLKALWGWHFCALVFQRDKKACIKGGLENIAERTAPSIMRTDLFFSVGFWLCSICSSVDGNRFWNWVATFGSDSDWNECFLWSSLPLGHSCQLMFSSVRSRVEQNSVTPPYCPHCAQNSDLPRFHFIFSSASFAAGEIAFVARLPFYVTLKVDKIAKLEPPCFFPINIIRDNSEFAHEIHPKHNHFYVFFLISYRSDSSALPAQPAARQAEGKPSGNGMNSGNCQGFTEDMWDPGWICT